MVVVVLFPLASHDLHLALGRIPGDVVDDCVELG